MLQPSFDLAAGPDTTSVVVQFSQPTRAILFLDLRICGNESCMSGGALLPMAMFSYCRIKGRVYRRSWCKVCEAERERRRHHEVVKIKQAREDAEAANFSQMMKQFWRMPS